MKADFWKYVSDNRPNEVRQIMDSFGYPYNERYTLSDQFRDFFSKCNSDQKEKVMVQCAMIHPDKELIEATMEEKKSKKVFKACGCGSAKGASGVSAPIVVSDADSKTQIEKLTQRQEMMREMNIKLISIALVSIMVVMFVKYVK